VLRVLDGSPDVGPAAEWALHCLAQTGEGVVAELPRRLAGERGLALLAAAYGVTGRVRWSRRTPRTRDRVIDGAAAMAGILEGLPAAAPLASVSSEPLRGHRAVIVTNVPIHYRLDVLTRLDALVRAAGADLHVVFSAAVPGDRRWIGRREVGFSHTFARSVDLGRRRGRRLFVPGLDRLLSELEASMVLAGGFSPLVAERAAAWCGRHGAAFGVWSGEIPGRPTANSSLRRVQRRRLLSRASFAVAYGSQSASYLRSIDGRLPIVIGRNTAPLPSGPQVPRAETGEVRLLAVSRAERGKALDLVVRAACRLESPLRLTVVGDGPELPRLKSLAAGSRRVHFTGALAPEETARRYLEADAFVFPSVYDVFGLVLVEAMGAGLAVATSDRPGAVPDLIVDGTNALVVSEASVSAWGDAMHRLACDHALRQRLGLAARATVAARWTPAHAAGAMLAGLRLGALAGPGGRTR
jgi:glycosyltransferase involved in cell wall biosynthesis